jgi:tetratricopeptide (TPR) repeat protein
MKDQTNKIIAESNILESRQKYNDALLLIQKARRNQPRDRILALRHAELLEAVKQYESALALYRMISEVDGENQQSDVHICQARCLVSLQRFVEAEPLLKDLHESNPSDTVVLTCLSALARSKGNLKESEKYARDALKIIPNYKIAVFELAHVMIDMKDDESAIKLLESNIFREDIHGDSIDLWLSVLNRLKRDRYTQEKLEMAAKDFPDRVEFYFALGVTAHRLGEASRARPMLEKAAELSPNNFRILHELGVMERTAGNTDLSQRLLEESLQLNPEQPAVLRTYGQEHKYIYGDPAFTRLNYTATKLADVPPLDQISLHYALGKAFEDVNELDTAFRHYETAGQKKRRIEPYNEKSSASFFQVMPKAINSKTQILAPQNGYSSEVPVFILGMPRSGTSLLEQILSAHPDIFGAGELKLLPSILDNIQYGQNRINLNEPEAFFPYKENASWEMRGKAYVEKLEALANKPYKRIVDKMPGNFTMVGLIHAILPNAKIIHSRRDPVETCLSNYRINFAEGQHWSYNLRELGRYYKRYWHLMEHWRKEYPGIMYEVKYEDNVADVESQSRSLINYLGLDWNENCLNFYNIDRPVRTASVSQVRKPIYTSSTNRWRKFEKYLKPLLDELGDIVPQYEVEVEAAAKGKIK